MKVIIQMQYSGVVRLLAGKKEDWFEFGEKPNLKKLLEEIECRYGKETAQECVNQMIFLWSPDQGARRQLKWPQNQNLNLEDASIVRIVSFVTGG